MSQKDFHLNDNGFFPTGGYDGSKPFVVLTVRDPIDGEGLSITCNTPEDFVNNWTRTQNITHGERHTWGGKYFFHSEGGPAAKFFDGSEVWFNNGTIHNESGPAVNRGEIDLYCLNGTFVEKSKFEWYLQYLKDIRGAIHPAGLIPTFPSGDEIRSAVLGSTILYFDLQGNFFWYKDGVLHNTTGPAVERTTGMVEYWENGKKIRESTGIFNRHNMVVEEVRETIEKALAGSASKKYESVKDIMEDPSWEYKIKHIFKSAGEQLIAGEGIDQVVQTFETFYGTQFHAHFSPALIEDFGEVIEDVWDAMGWTPVEKRHVPVLEELNVPKLEEIVPEQPLLSTEAAFEAIKKFAAAIDERKKEKEEFTKVLEKVNISDKLMETVNDALDQLREKETLDDSGFIKIVVPSEMLQKSIQEPIVVSDTPVEQEDTGWGVPLGMLAVAGIMGMIGKKTVSPVKIPEVAVAQVAQPEAIKV